MSQRQAEEEKQGILNEIRHGMCCSKRRYQNSYQGERTVEKMANRGLDPNGRLVVYSCVFCNGYHVCNFVMNRHSHYGRMLRIENLIDFGFDEPCPYCEREKA